eukprot:GEMP01002896.1.p1 GENE.GEMP01002896.1~~GEMP01002896.1.p1  ORF type:complete len:1228 (+),score=351.55 GEMP01002896.1:750-4433(+)
MLTNKNAHSKGMFLLLSASCIASQPTTAPHEEQTHNVMLSVWEAWSTDHNVVNACLLLAEEIVMVFFFIYFGNRFFAKLKHWQQDHAWRSPGGYRGPLRSERGTQQGLFSRYWHAMGSRNEAPQTSTAPRGYEGAHTKGDVMKPGGAQTLNRGGKPAYDLSRLEEQMEAIEVDGTGPASTGHYAALIKAAVQQEQISRAEYWFDHMEQCGYVPDPNLYTTLISGFAHLKNIRKAEDWLNRLRRNAKHYGYSGVAAHYDEERQQQQLRHAQVTPEEQQRCVREQEKKQEQDQKQQEQHYQHQQPNAPNSSFSLAYNSVINAAAQVGNLSKAHGWFHEMKASGLIPDVFTYTSIINAAAEAKKPKEAEVWFNKMIDANLRPSVASFNSVMKAWVRCGDPTNAVRWFEKLQADEELVPNEITYSILVNAFSHHHMVPNGLHRTEACLEEMIKRGLTPTPKIFSRAICSCAQAKNTTKAEFWFHKMISQGVEPDHQTYNALINAMAQSGKLQKAEDWFQEMQKVGFEPDAISYAQLMNACAEAKNGARAEHWFNEMQSRANNPIIADKFAYNTLIKAWGRAKDVEKTVTWFRRMKTQGNIDPCDVSYSSVICAAARAGSPKTGEHFLLEMIDYGLKPDCFNYNSLIQAYAAVKDALNAEKWLEELILACPHASCSARVSHNGEKGGPGEEDTWDSSGCSHQNLVRVYATVIKVLAKENYAEKAHSWAQKLLDAHGKLTFDVVKPLIEAMVDAALYAEAAQWLKYALQTSTATTALCNAVLAGCTPTNRLRDQLGVLDPDALLEDMKLRGIASDQETVRIIDSIKATISPNMQTFVQDTDRRSSRTYSFSSWGGGDGQYRLPERADRASRADTQAAKTGMTLPAYLQKLEEEGVQPTVQVFETFIHYAAVDMQGSLMEKAKKAEEYMRQMLAAVGEPKENHSYHMLIRAFAKAKDAHKAEDWIAHMYEAHRRVPTLVHNAVIDCWASVGDADRAIHWLEKLDSNTDPHDPQPDCYSYNGVIKACAYAKSGPKAEYWFQRMQQHNNLVPDLITFNGVVNAWARTPSIERAEEWLKKMSAAGVMPDSISYQIIIKACVNSHSPEKAQYWLDEMKKSGNIEPTIMHYNSVLDALARSKKVYKAEKWVLSMKERSAGAVVPNTQSYNILLKACANVNDALRGDSWFEYMTEYNIKKDYWTYKQYSFCYVNCGDLRRAKRIMQEAMSKGLKESREWK